MPDMNLFLTSSAKAVKFNNDVTARIKLTGAMLESIKQKTRYIRSQEKRFNSFKYDIGKALSECISIIKRRRLY
jgi:hypothetical protein